MVEIPSSDVYGGSIPSRDGLELWGGRPDLARVDHVQRLSSQRIRPCCPMNDSVSRFGKSF